jgi:hypothetical protein
MAGVIESHTDTGDEMKEEELHCGLVVELSTYESQSDLRMNTANYSSNASLLLRQTHGHPNYSRMK